MVNVLDLALMLPTQYLAPTGGGGTDGASCAPGTSPSASGCYLGFLPTSGDCGTGCSPAGAGCNPIGIVPL